LIRYSTGTAPREYGDTASSRYLAPRATVEEQNAETPIAENIREDTGYMIFVLRPVRNTYPRGLYCTLRQGELNLISALLLYHADRLWPLGPLTASSTLKLLARYEIR
jgi:hypothetical protein